MNSAGSSSIGWPPLLNVCAEIENINKQIMDPIEVEFIGEDTTVGIIPNFSFEPIHLISGTIGPFRAGLGSFPTVYCLESFDFVTNIYVPNFE